MWFFPLGDLGKKIKQTDDGKTVVYNDKRLYSIEFMTGQVIACLREKMYKVESGVTKYSADGGSTWVNTTGVTETPSVGHILLNGTVLLFSSSKIFRSTNGKDFVAYDFSTYGINYPPYYHGIDSGGGYGSDQNIVIFAEYTGNNGTLKVFRSVDGGVNWSSVLSAVAPDEIRHFHTVHYDRHTRKWYVTSGDNDHQCHWWVSDDQGVTWTKIVDGNAVENFNPQMYRNVNMVFTEDGHVIWGSDSSYGTSCGVYEARFDSITSPKRLTDLPAICYGVRGSGLNLIAITRPAALTPELRAYILSSADLGRSWKVEYSHEIANTTGDGGFYSIYGPNNRGEYFVNFYALKGVDPSYRTIKLKPIY